LNETIRRALVSAGIPSILEPPGTSRDDGKAPDGMTLVPWSSGKPLVWDVTTADTLAPSYLNRTSKESGAASNFAEEKKIRKYSSLKNSFIFMPAGFETLGSWGTHCIQFIKEISNRITSFTGEKRSLEFLKQRLSLDIQRGNAAAVMSTIPPSRSLDDYFVGYADVAVPLDKEKFESSGSQVHISCPNISKNQNPLASTEESGWVPLGLGNLYTSTNEYTNLSSVLARGGDRSFFRSSPSDPGQPSSFSSPQMIMKSPRNLTNLSLLSNVSQNTLNLSLNNFQV
jgi:hypothetical protein